MTSKALFAVHREGVYRHECAGIYSELELAIGAARACASADGDSYHRYEVRPYALDAAPRFQGEGRPSPDIAEGDPLYSIRKSEIEAES